MRPNPAFVRAEAPREEAVAVIRRYDVLALPVINGGDRLVGIVTYDDAMDVAKEETDEDFHRVGGLGHVFPSVRDASVKLLYQKRVFWLVILVFGNIFSGAGIAYFEETIEAYIALVFFLPLLVDSGGNAGSQSATLMVRALATGDVRMGDWGKMLGREVAGGGAARAHHGSRRLADRALARRPRDRGGRLDHHGSDRPRRQPDRHVDPLRAVAAQLRPRDRLGAPHHFDCGRDRCGDLLRDRHGLSADARRRRDRRGWPASSPCRLRQAADGGAHRPPDGGDQPRSPPWLLGGLIGAERQWRQRLAGLRTNTLVAVGAASFVDLLRRSSPTRSARPGSPRRSSRGSASSAPGIIFREGLNVRGLNTAATLWCSAARPGCSRARGPSPSPRS
jgi:CBS domain-containing protein